MCNWLATSRRLRTSTRVNWWRKRSRARNRRCSSGFTIGPKKPEECVRSAGLAEVILLLPCFTLCENRFDDLQQLLLIHLLVLDGPGLRQNTHENSEPPIHSSGLWDLIPVPH